MRPLGRAARRQPRLVRPLGIRYRISALLVALAIVPLCGVAWFGVREVQGAESSRRQAESVDAAVNRLALLTELKSRLQDERNWSAGTTMMGGLGLDAATVDAMIGVDMAHELAQTELQVDELISRLGLDALGRDVIALRSARGSGDPFAGGFRYDDIEKTVSDEGQQILDDLLLDAGQLRGGHELVLTLRVLEASTAAEEAVSTEFTTYFRSQFATTAAAIDPGALAGQRALLVEAHADVDRSAGPGSQSRQVITAITASPDAQSFSEAVDQLIDRGLGAQVDTTSGSHPTASTDLGQIATLFHASRESTRLHFALVGAAGQDALHASSSLTAAADRDFTRALSSVAILTAISLLFSAAATRAVTRPVRRLAAVAGRISDGDPSARFGDTGGSIEIRAAGKAIDLAAAHLELAEHQAKALADGELDHPILSQTTVGRLGASLQEAVEALASSMQEREEFRHRMTHEATHDGLTQIANRNASLAQLRRGLARVRRSDAQLAILFIDLDGFKGINDTHGHHAGDVVLRTTAQRLVNGVRDGDHVGRLGGDEFIVIAEPVSGLGEASALAERLLAELAQPVQVDHSSLSIRASVGIALSDGQEDHDSAELLRDADLAVYKAKAAGRSRVEVCDDDLRSELFERADIERALHRAIDELEFVLYYQPIIEPADLRLCGFEALIRWNRPGHGMVSPDSFIPVAERSDLILSIDRWVVGAAARQLNAWEHDGAFAGLPVSVNISGRHLGSPSFIDDVLAPLRDHDVDPSRIIIEITESALLDDLDGAAAKLALLRSHGVRVAIDDFGTGYTSLAHLKSLPIDILKIDRSYTSDEAAASLVQLVIHTGHLLGATITAEGIETPEQAARLAEMGSDELQGYLYGRPRPAGELRQLGTATSGSSSQVQIQASLPSGSASTQNARA